MNTSEANNYLYHYTSVDTLELILSGNKIKFNSLDNLDDLKEGISQDATEIRRFTYVSCWTDEDFENIPMWNMYSSLTDGVRIKMKKHPFELFDNKQYAGIVDGADLIQDNSPHRFSLIPMHELMSLPYFLPMANSNNFLYKVGYTSDTELLNPTILGKKGKKLEIYQGKIGRYKMENWRFQNEWRYIIDLVPMNILDSIKNKFALPLTVSKMFDNNFVSPIKMFDLKLSNEAISSMQITLSPNISETSKRKVHSLRDQYAPKAIILESELSGTMR